jgi:hypothetical protein
VVEAIKIVVDAPQDRANAGVALLQLRLGIVDDEKSAKICLGWQDMLGQAN